MNGHELLDKIGLIDPAYIEAAEAPPKKKKVVWVKWGALAACLCFAFVGVFGWLREHRDSSLQREDSGYSAADYFKDCDTTAQFGMSTSPQLADSALPYTETRDFSDRRGALEANGVIPIIETHPLFSLQAHYNEDGSLYCVELFWYRRDSLEAYSDLKVVTGYEEVKIPSDCIVVEVDENGDPIEPAVTVTERDGVQIIGYAGNRTDKTLTYQNENGWYQISGSWNDSYEAVVELLDWFWDHPLDLEQFPMEAGDEYTFTSLSEMPDAFSEYLPDFSAFGFIESETSLVLKNGIPVRFEGFYVAHASEEQVRAYTFYEVEGYTMMHWGVNAEPDVYDLEDCLGDIHTLTREQILDILEGGSRKVSFMQGDLLVFVYPDDANEAWQLIESLMDK